MSRVVLADGTEDVWTMTEGGDEPETGYEEAGSVPTVDVVSAVVSHRRRTLLVRVHVVDLKRVHSQLTLAVIDAPEDLWFAGVHTSPGHRAGRHGIGDYDGQERRCRGMRHDVDYSADEVELRIPRRCLDRPRSVTVSVMQAMWKKLDDGAVSEFVDNPHNAGHMPGETRRLFRAS